MNILFFFDEWHKDVWSGRPVDLDAWFCLRYLWGVNNISCINNTANPITVGKDGFHEYASLDEFLLARKNDNFIQFELANKNKHSVLLNEFEYPKDPDVTAEDNFLVDGLNWYMFGPAKGWGDTVIEGSTIVALPQRSDYKEAHHAPFIAAVVAYDHFVRS